MTRHAISVSAVAYEAIHKISTDRNTSLVLLQKET